MRSKLFSLISILAYKSLAVHASFHIQTPLSSRLFPPVLVTPPTTIKSKYSLNVIPIRSISYDFQESISITKIESSTLIAISDSITLSTSASSSTSSSIVDVIGPSETLEGLFWGISIALLIAYVQNKTDAPLVMPWQNLLFVDEKKNNEVGIGDKFLDIQIKKSQTSENINNNNTFDNTVSINATNAVTPMERQNVFDEKSWKEISRPENYIFYNRRLNDQNSMKRKFEYAKGKGEKENRIFIISLLVLFVPIFSIEFFFALSRQIICGVGMDGVYGDPFTRASWADRKSVV